MIFFVVSTSNVRRRRESSTRLLLGAGRLVLLLLAPLKPILPHYNQSFQHSIQISYKIADNSSKIKQGLNCKKFETKTKIQKCYVRY